MSHNILLHKEILKQNLSTKQIIDILNKLINSVAEPLFNNTQLMRSHILQALLQTQSDHRRKISTHNKDETVNLIVSGVIHKDFKYIKMCGIDRDILFKSSLAVIDLLEQAKENEKSLLNYNTEYNAYRKHFTIAKKLGCQPDMMAILYRWVMPFLKLYREFKEQIAAKYYRWLWQEANKARAITGLNVDITELFKNYLLALDKALDKCNSDKGTLTSYISQWVMSARSTPDFDHQYGVAFDIPASIRKKRESSGETLTNMSQQINDEHNEIIDQDAQDSLHNVINHDNVLLNCLRHVKNAREVILLLNIPIVLQPKEITQLKGIG